MRPTIIDDLRHFIGQRNVDPTFADRFERFLSEQVEALDHAAVLQAVRNSLQDALPVASQPRRIDDVTARPFAPARTTFSVASRPPYLLDDCNDLDADVAVRHSAASALRSLPAEPQPETLHRRH